MSNFPDVPGYRVTGEVGRGGFAVVYRAEQVSLEREVALKVLSVLDLSAEEVARFKRECATLARLDWHPNILRIMDTGLTNEGRPYLSMELLEAGSVGARHLGTPMPIDDVVELGTQITGALVAAHAANILHRDVKPANILIDRTGRYRLADFGIASIVGSTRSSSTGMAGTVGYLAPELILGKKATVQSDVYSLAATLHALVTGTPPFSRPTDETAAAAIARTLHEPAADLRQFGAPEWFAVAIERALDKDPERRFATADDFARALVARGDVSTVPLTAVSGASASAAADIIDPPTVRRPIAPAAAATIGAGGAGGAAEAAFRSDTPTRDLPPIDDGATVIAKRWPAAPVTEPARRRGRGPLFIAAAVVTLLGTAVGVTYAATRGDDQPAVASDQTTASSAGSASTATTVELDADAATATAPSGDTVSGSTAVEVTTPASTSPQSTVPGATVPNATVAPGSPTTVARPGVTTTQVQSLPPSPAATVAAPTATTAPTTVTTRPVTTAPSATTAPVTAAPVTAAPVTAATTPPTTPRPNPVVNSISASGSGSTWTFTANASRCQDRERWVIAGPTPITKDSGDIGWHCYPVNHSSLPQTLAPGNYTITLTLWGNGQSSSQTLSHTVPAAVTTTAPPSNPTPVVNGISASGSGTTWTFFGNASRCQDRERWVIAGPTPITLDSGDIGWHCYDVNHSTRAQTLSPGTYTITLTLWGNGQSSSQSITHTVPG